MIDPPQLPKQADFMALEVCNLSKAKKDFASSMDELFEQDDVGFDPGGKPKVVLAEKSEMIDDDDVFTIERLIVNEVLMVSEELVPMKITDELEVKKETSELDAQHMFDEMPKWMTSLKIKSHTPMLSRASSCDDTVDPINPLVSEFGLAKVHFTLQRWTLTSTWIIVNPDAQILLFDPGGTRLSFLVDADIGSNEGQDRLKVTGLMGMKVAFEMPKLFADVLDFKGTPVSLAQGQYALKALEVLDTLLAQEEITSDYKGIVSFDPGGDLHTLGDYVLSINTSKLTEIGKGFRQLSYAEIGVIAFLRVNIHFLWNTKLRLENGESILRNEVEDNLWPLHFISKQKLELFYHEQFVSDKEDAVTYIAMAYFTTDMENHLLESVTCLDKFCFDPGGVGAEMFEYSSHTFRGFADVDCQHTMILTIVDLFRIQTHNILGTSNALKAFKVLVKAELAGLVELLMLLFFIYGGVLQEVAVFNNAKMGRLSVFVKCSCFDFQWLVFDHGITPKAEWRSGIKTTLYFVEMLPGGSFLNYLLFIKV